LLLSEWDGQRDRLRPTVDQANALYDKLLDRLNGFSKRSQD